MATSLPGTQEISILVTETVWPRRSKLRNPTRADMLRLINDVGRFDISGNIMTFGPQMQDVPPKVFLTVIQPDGTFKAVEKL